MEKPLKITRRKFIGTGTTAAIGMAAVPLISNGEVFAKPSRKSSIGIQRVISNFEREPLKRPFGFKGNAMTNVWQTAAYIESTSGTSKVGLGTQNTLWSDPQVFLSHSEQGSNALMYAMSEKALQLIRGRSFTTPIALMDEVLPEILDYGKFITGNNNLKTTFALNSLICVDNALWLLYAEENDIQSFDEMIPIDFRDGLSARHDKVASIPALGYGTTMKEIKQLADEGFFIMKIKIGAAGDQKQMLEQDKQFLKNIHQTIGHFETPFSENGKIPYYFDANGRYQKKETLLRFLDYAEKINALDQIALLEEPFGEENTEVVNDITERGIFVAADESAHTDEDTINRIDQGYNAIAVKAIAKTLSMTMKIAQVAYERQVPCFCADLTVNPILVDWNKCVAARLPGLGGMNIGLQETNGWQNYANWDKMLSYHPTPEAPWIKPNDGLFSTGPEFFKQSGGIFKASPHYLQMFKN